MERFMDVNTRRQIFLSVFFFFKDKYSGYGGQFNAMKLKLAYIW